MRIFTVLIDTFYSLQASTGIKTYISELCEIDSGGSYHYIPFPKISTINKITVFKNNNRTGRLIFHCCYFLWKTVWLPVVVKWYKADAVICPDFVGPMWKMEAIKIITMHDATFWKFPKEFGGLWRKYITTMIHLGCRGKSQIIATSDYTRKSLPSSLSKVPAEVVYQSSSRLSRHKFVESNSWTNELGLESGKYFLHVGFFGKRKNIKTLVNAFDMFQKQNGDYKLVLVGGKAIDGYMDEHSNIEKLVLSLSLNEKVIIPGYVEDEVLAGLYKNAAMYVFPSYEEGFGIPILEAWQFELPVIVSNSGALPEVGGDAVLVFEPFDAPDLSNKMYDLVADQVLREQMIEKGRRRLNQFAKERFYEKINLLVEDRLNPD